MIDKVSTDNCCLCKSCSNICPKDAISFTKNKKGFLYPVIDEDSCVRCNLCEKACPTRNERKSAEQMPLAFAARSKDTATRLSSTSGGIFYEAAGYVRKQGGYVCGAVFDDRFRVVHAITTDQSVLDQMRGSKYAQSDTEGTYREIKKLLDHHQTVLFCGCPCQISGLRCYLGKNYDNLYLIDFVCHGISGGNTLEGYIQVMEKKYRSHMRSLSFRDKANGWHNSAVKIEFANGKTYSAPMVVDAYMRACLEGTTLKESCYSCKFKNFSSGSDLTLGDFWGAEVSLPSMDDNTGLSAVFVNSEKGSKLLKELEIELQQVKAETVIQYNRNVIEPPKPNDNRKAFYEFAALTGIGQAIQHYYQETAGQKLKRKARYAVRCVYYRLLGRNKPLY